MLPENGPDRIGRYELHGLLARGGMGRLYLARDPNTGRLVVLKLMDGTLDSAELRDRFDREARSLASLNHPNIVHIDDYGDHQGSPFIVMEFVRGETLEEKIRRRAQLSVPQKLRLLVELCSGLAHAHQSGIIHRDVKPANLMVDQDDHLKILDFGIARVSGSNRTRMVNPLESAAPTQVGTLGYMSPEQTQGQGIDVRSDVFAVGAVAYELFAGVPAFTGATARELEASVLRAQPLPLTTRVPGLDVEIDGIVRTALSRDPNDRYKDVGILAQAFERCRARLDPAGAQSGPSRAGGSAAAPNAPATVRAGSAYVRAVAAFKEQATELARRCALEALAEDPAHTGARALLTRLDQSGQPAPASRSAAAKPAPQAGSFWDGGAGSSPSSFGHAGQGGGSLDPTVLIAVPKGGPSAQPPAPIEQTVILRRDQLPGFGPSRGEETVAISAADLPPLSPTPAAPPPPASAASSADVRPSPKKPAGGMLAGLQGLFGRKPSSTAGAAAATSRRELPVSPVVLIALVAFVLVGALVYAGIHFGSSLWASGQTVTLTKPTGGTIVGGGLECGTRGSNCSSRFKDGDSVEFQAVADAGYVFTSFMGDCAPTGRMLMTSAKTCGATFQQIGASASPGVNWPLTITKPTGGTIVAAGGVLCGSLGSNCTASVPDGAPVNLHVEPDSGFAFVAYTGDCAPNGETTMTAARSCGATFAPTGAPPKVDVPSGQPPGGGGRRAGGSAINVAPPPPPPVAPVAPPQAPAAPAEPLPAAPSPLDGPKVPPAISPEEHARLEIEQLVKDYCSDLESLNPDRVSAHFQLPQRQLRDQFRQYQRLNCSITTEKPKFDNLAISAAGGSGTARVLFDMKQVIQMKSGGAPQTVETNVTMIASRPTQRDPWKIERVEHKPKPKP